MTSVVSIWMTLFSVLVPAKMWFAPTQPVLVQNKSDSPVSLVMKTFDGKGVDSAKAADVAANANVDVRSVFPSISDAGTYVLFAMKQGAGGGFVGTPTVISTLADRRPGAPPGAMVSRVSPLQYVVMTTDQGPMTMAFYYDSAPNTVESFLRLASQGYFDGLTFHRIIPNFVLQGGDPRGDGTGSPGYNVGAEFSDRPHEEGALSMARSGDPDEAPGVMPRAEFANSAGSQFFVCLNYENTKQLDRRYTVFGKVVDGLEVMRKLAATPLSDPQAGKPVKAPVITKAEVFGVLPGHNPYQTMIGATTSPSSK